MKVSRVVIRPASRKVQLLNQVILEDQVKTPEDPVEMLFFLRAGVKATAMLRNSDKLLCGPPRELWLPAPF